MSLSIHNYINIGYILITSYGFSHIKAFPRKVCIWYFLWYDRDFHEANAPLVCPFFALFADANPVLVMVHKGC